MKRRRFGARRVGRGGRRGGRTVPGAVHLADATASESAGLEASRARVPRACVARREVTARSIGAACHSLAKLPKVFARSVSDVRICRSHVMTNVKISTCEWTSSAEKRKNFSQRKRDATKPRVCFPSSGTARKYPRGVRFSPGAIGSSRKKFLVFWEFSAVLGWNPKHGKSAFCTRQKSNRLVQIRRGRGRSLRPLLRALDRCRDIARVFRTGTSPPAFPPSRGRSDDRSSTTADPPPRRVSSPKTRFLFSCHVECVITESCLHLSSQYEPRAPRQAPRARRARASRRVFFAHASLTLFRATRRRAFDRRASLLVS